MASSSIQQHSTSIITYTFSTPIKLDRSNFSIWKTQVLASIRGNGLEGFISGAKLQPPSTIIEEGMVKPNSAYEEWERCDQQLMSWMLSSMSLDILSLVVNSKTSFELWKSLNKQFGSESMAKKIHHKIMLNNLTKGSMSISEYYTKLKSIVNDLAMAGHVVSEVDIITHLISGLGIEYYPTIVHIEANMLNMTSGDAYALLLSHEARLAKDNSSFAKEMRSDFEANIVHTNGSKVDSYAAQGRGYGRGGFQAQGRGGYNGQNRPVWNGFQNNNQVRGGWNGNQGVLFDSFGGRGNSNVRANGVLCQICYKPNHTAFECYNRFNQSYVPRPPRPNPPQSLFRPPPPHMTYGSPYSLNSPQYHPSPSPYPQQNSFNTSDQIPSHDHNANSSGKEALITTTDGVADQGWYLDSGATHHLTNAHSNLQVSKPYEGMNSLLVGNGQGLAITHIGSLVLNTLNDACLHLSEVLCVPKITKNLISISQLMLTNPLTIEFISDFCMIKDKEKGTLLAKGVMKGGLYKLLSKDDESSASLFISAPNSMLSTFNSVPNKCKDTFELFHNRFGHPNRHALQVILRSNLLSTSGCTLSPHFCDACQHGKLHKFHFPSTTIKSTSPLELLHTDLWGPAPQLSMNGYRYYVSFVDDFTRYTWIFPLVLKSDTLSTFKTFKTLVEKQFGFPIKAIQSDMGGEFTAFTSFLQNQGIQHRFSCPHTHHQNGVAERKHRHIVESGLTLLAQAHLPFTFWWEAFHTSSYLINRLPTTILNNHTPYELLHKHKPDYSFLKVFGCSCFPLLRPYRDHKLDFHTQKCVFIGYSPLHKGYKCLDKSGRVFIARHVTFNETEFPYALLFQERKTTTCSSSHPTCSFNVPSSPPHHQDGNVPRSPQMASDASASAPTSLRSDSNLSLSNSNFGNSLHDNLASSPILSSSSQNSPPTPPFQRQTRTKSGVLSPKDYTEHSPSPYSESDYLNFLSHKSSSPTYKTFTLSPQSYLAINHHLEPSSVKAALANPTWHMAMKDEFDALQRNQTWTLVPPSPSHKIVGNKWVFRVKYNPDGTIAKHKARLVAKGFHQTYGVDYYETFSPVVKPCTIRIILSLAVMRGWSIRQLDINNAFLNGVLTESVFMSQPEGFLDPCHPNHVCKLNKALYGLKQAPRAWYDSLKGSLLQWNFVSSKADTSLFIQHHGSDVVIVLIYVDDILITGSSSTLVDQVITNLGTTYALKDLGDFTYFLGLEVTPCLDGLHLSQTKYIGDILKKANMIDCKGISTPMSTTDKLLKDKGSPFETPFLYRSIIGSLQYLLLTRPEIAFTVNKLSQFLSAPTSFHWQACKRVLRYLQCTSHYGLMFTRHGSLQLNAYTDADWGADLDDRRSVGGYCIYLGSNLVSWSSKKQHIVSRSTAESEYRALALGTSEVLWITYLLQELHVSLPHTPLLYCDNKSAEALASNPKYHSRTKHIELDLHFVRDHIANKRLQVVHVSSEDQIADILTKPLAHDPFVYFRSKLNVVPRP